MNNLFALPHHLPPEEWFETLCTFSQGRIERIISHGQTTPPDQWYDQPQAEWVTLLQGEAWLLYADGEEQHLYPGHWLLIPPHRRHRVSYTSENPPCIWLAVHFEVFP